jgi:hypothetical protein
MHIPAPAHPPLDRDREAVLEALLLADEEIDQPPKDDDTYDLL